ncbi:hypothetical protein [Leucobacter aridicollis]|uniref:Uncharacterized protein n=1 Tax=Leucobacter aridicollis TaxID=283878 RepID=A0A852QXG8_9MICO|nr:hypothetical protein [Leucobacter aridicollis]MBL3681885.1 hypothetical protein [Leucobacter aridicollis]NYD27073.1 hypothetical protein [Leucobacter aridicollis]
MDEYVPQGLFWISLALVNAGLAEQKNRSRFSWFLLSLVLGPFATFYIVAAAAPTPAAEPTPAAAPNPAAPQPAGTPSVD